MEQNITTVTIETTNQEEIYMDGLCFAACCRSCAYYEPDDSESGWCSYSGGWVSPDKWACSNYA